jgi:aminopeptidase N
VAWSALWDEFYETGEHASELEEAAFRVLKVEKDELIAKFAISSFFYLYWQFLPEDQRLLYRQKWENALWEKVMSKAPKNLRTIYWWDYVSVAGSPQAIGNLEAVWSRKQKLPNLPLSEADELRLTSSLAIRAPEKAEALLSFEEKRLLDPDRQEEFLFIRPALSADPNIRRDFFFSLKDPANRKKEPWVENALQLLNHQLSKNTEFMVGPGLEWMTEIQRTGNVFFPGRWIGAILGGQSSPEAAKTVRKFLSTHPAYPEDLKKKILQAADLLFRAAR